MSPPSDPRSDPQVLHQPPMPSTPQLSHVFVAQPLEPHTFEELSHESSEEKFPDLPPDSDGCNAYKYSDDQDMAGDEVFSVNDPGEPVVRTAEQCSNITDISIASQKPSTSTDQLHNRTQRALSLDAEKPRMIARKRAGSTSNKNGSIINSNHFHPTKNPSSDVVESGHAPSSCFWSDSTINQKSLRESPGALVDEYERCPQENNHTWGSGYVDHLNGSNGATQSLGVDTGVEYDNEGPPVSRGPPRERGVPHCNGCRYGSHWGYHTCGSRSNDEDQGKNFGFVDSSDQPPASQTWGDSERRNGGWSSGQVVGREETHYPQAENHAGVFQTEYSQWGWPNATSEGWNNVASVNSNATDYNINGEAFHTNQQRNQSHVRSRRSSLLQNTSRTPAGYHQARPISDATVRPFIQSQPHPPANALSEVHTHYHHHIYDNKGPQLGSPGLQQNEQMYIRELREQNSNLTELLTEQRVRIAVLENELKYAKEDKENAVNASIFVAQTLGYGFQAKVDTLRQMSEEQDCLSSDGAVCNSTLETERLTNDNSDLSNSFKSSVNRFARNSSSVESGDIHNPALTTWNTKDKEKDDERPIAASENSTAIHTTLPSVMKKEAPGRMQAAYEKDKLARLQKVAAGPVNTLSQDFERSSSESETVTGREVSGWNESFSSDATTILNSPKLNILSPTFASTGQRMNQMSDVGLLSLDENLEDDLAIYPPIPISSKRIKPLSDQNESHTQVTYSITDVPPPSVLRTGFDLKNAKRGAEYNHLAPQPEFGRGGMKNFSQLSVAATPRLNTDSSVLGLFSSLEEKEGALASHQSQISRDGLRFPDMFRYGVQYVPEEDDENYLRTVCISNLPTNIELRDVLARVRGGMISNAVLMDTRSVMQGTKSAMVFFLEDYEAKAFVDHASAHPIAFGSEDETIQTLVALLPTPTYPLSYGIIRRMKADQGGTRCLQIHNFPINLSLSKLQRDIACRNLFREDNLVEIFLDESATLHLEFSSIQLARSSFGILTKFLSYQGLEVDFAPDPCAGPLSELDLPVPPRPPIIPRYNNSSPHYGSDSFTPSLNVGPITGLTQVGGEVIPAYPPKQLTSLNLQPVNIPSFSGKNLKNSSWADECIEASNTTDKMYPTRAANHNRNTNMPTNAEQQYPAGPSGFNQSIQAAQQPMNEDAETQYRGRKLMESIAEESPSKIEEIMEQGETDAKTTTFTGMGKGKGIDYDKHPGLRPSAPNFRNALIPDNQYSRFLSPSDLHSQETTRQVCHVHPIRQPVKAISQPSSSQDDKKTVSGLAPFVHSSAGNSPLVDRPAHDPFIDDVATTSTTFEKLTLSPLVEGKSIVIPDSPTRDEARTKRDDFHARCMAEYARDPVEYNRMLARGYQRSRNPIAGQPDGWIRSFNSDGSPIIEDLSDDVIGEIDMANYEREEAGEMSDGEIELIKLAHHEKRLAAEISLAFAKNKAAADAKIKAAADAKNKAAADAKNKAAAEAKASKQAVKEYVMKKMAAKVVSKQAYPMRNPDEIDLGGGVYMDSETVLTENVTAGDEIELGGGVYMDSETVLTEDVTAGDGLEIGGGFYMSSETVRPDNAIWRQEERKRRRSQRRQENN